MVLYRDDKGAWKPVDVVHKGFDGRSLTGEVLPPETGFTGPDRLKYTFKCDWCKRTVPCRGEKLTPILDTLAAHGVSRVSLSGIAARL